MTSSNKNIKSSRKFACNKALDHRSSESHSSQNAVPHPSWRSVRIAVSDDKVCTSSLSLSHSHCLLIIIVVVEWFTASSSTRRHRFIDSRLVALRRFNWNCSMCRTTTTARALNNTNNLQTLNAFFYARIWTSTKTILDRRLFSPK